MSDMADRTGAGPERRRLKTLAQAALNADVTVGQLEDAGYLDLGHALLDDLRNATANGAVPQDGYLHRLPISFNCVSALAVRRTVMRGTSYHTCWKRCRA